MHRLRTLVILVMLSACQSRQAETTAQDTIVEATEEEDEELAPIRTLEEIDPEEYEDETYYDEDEISPDGERIISFQEFHSKYIATGKLRTLELPLVMPIVEDPSSPPIYTLESPAGAFQNILSQNYEVRVLGLLPDTSQYYGVVYDYQMGHPLVSYPSRVYSTRVATFSRTGEFLGRAIIVDVGDFEGASSCGSGIDNVMHGYIDKNLSFFGIHIFTQDCTNEDRGRPAQVTRSSFGRINIDGTIASNLGEAEEFGPEDDIEAAQKLRIEFTPLRETIQRLNNHESLRAGDLTNFFTESSLRESPPYSWYTLYFPTGNLGLTCVVRRMAPVDMRLRHYGFAIVKGGSIGKPFSYEWEDSNLADRDLTYPFDEPSVIAVDDHFVLIKTTEVPRGKYVQVENHLLIISGNDLLPAEQMSADELRIQRNWLFAKRGMKFNSADLASYFSQFEWYKPVRANVTNAELGKDGLRVLTAIQELEKDRARGR